MCVGVELINSVIRLRAKGWLEESKGAPRLCCMSFHHQWHDKIGRPHCKNFVAENGRGGRSTQRLTTAISLVGTAIASNSLIGTAMSCTTR